MSIIELLKKFQEDIIDAASLKISADKLKGYEKAGNTKIKMKVKDLYSKIIECLQSNELIPVLNHTEKIAAERFSSGYDLYEIQAAINAIEENIWLKIFKNLKADELEEALRLVSTILGAAKDNLARTYVSLATKTKVSTLNLNLLHSGSESISLSDE